MKKFILIFVMAFMPMFMFADGVACTLANGVSEAYGNGRERVASTLANGVSEAYGDGRDAVETLYNDGKGIVNTVYSDGKGLISTVYSDGKDFLANAYPEVKEAIISIASAIGVAAEHVYGVLVKKFFVDGLTELFVFIVGLILFIVGWVKFDKYVNKRPLLKDEKGNESMAPVDWHIIYPLAILIGGIVTVLNVEYHDMFLNLVNPEWGAINYILDFTKTMVH